ncbi:DUF3574 domain-containing protein [Humitalea sp. 24SJ18S-53]|uniref:DUF3574 domain-containing protein n=1 Tax=Humitalea sp. 24SJ18S-53 TaxID=3422307 RepID=UPI003D66EBDA
MRLAAAALLLAGCAAQTDALCPAGFAPATIAEAYFGVRDPAAWTAFLADTVTPAFPDGLTHLAAGGQWRQGGAIGREDSRVLVLVLPGASLADAAARLAPVEAAWRDRQAQQSVLRVLRPGCAAF